MGLTHAYGRIDCVVCFGYFSYHNGSYQYDGKSLDAPQLPQKTGYGSGPKAIWENGGAWNDAERLGRDHLRRFSVCFYSNGKNLLDYGWRGFDDRMYCGWTDAQLLGDDKIQ